MSLELISTIPQISLLFRYIKWFQPPSLESMCPLLSSPSIDLATCVGDPVDVKAPVCCPWYLMISIHGHFQQTFQPPQFILPFKSQSFTPAVYLESSTGCCFDADRCTKESLSMTKRGAAFNYFKCLGYNSSGELKDLTSGEIKDRRNSPLSFTLTVPWLGCKRSSWNISEAMILYSEMSGSQQPVARPRLSASSLFGLRLSLDLEIKCQYS